MHQHLQVCILQVQRHHPISRTNREKNRLKCLHLEGCLLNPQVQSGKVDDWSPRPRSFHYQKQPAVKARRGKRSNLYGTLVQKSLNLSLQSFAPDRVGGNKPAKGWDPWIRWEPDGRESGIPTARPPLPKVPRPRRSTPASGATDNRLQRLDWDMTPTSENPCPGWRKESCLYPYARVYWSRKLAMRTVYDSQMC